MELSGCRVRGNRAKSLRAALRRFTRTLPALASARRSGFRCRPTRAPCANFKRRQIGSRRF